MSTPLTLVARRRSVLLRIHFWAALIASPFAIVAACTGLLYVFTPQVEAALYAPLDRVAPAGPRRPLDVLVQAAQAAAPADLGLRSVLVPGAADASVQVLFGPARAPAAAAQGEHAGHAGHAGAAGQAGQAVHAGHAGHAGHDGAAPVAAPLATAAPAPAGDRLPRGTVVYVNPYTAQVLGSQAEMQRFSQWSRRLHSSLLQGEGWRWPIELTASWLLVMLLSGIYLWWPRERVHAPPLAAARGRSAWRVWHPLVGVLLSVMSLAIVLTGLTWSRYAGDQIRALRDAIGQAPPAAPRGLRSVAAPGQPALDWDAVLQAARRHAPEVSLVLTPPRDARGTWRIGTSEQTPPRQKINLVLDAYSGATLFQAGWDRQTAFGKATAIGIPLHRGEFGWWNQALLFLFGAGVLFSLVSGWVMFLQRRRQGRAVLPRLLPGAWKSLPTGAWLAAALLLALLPLLAASAVLVALAEAVLAWRQHSARMLLAQG